MARIIKFRGKSVANGLWVYGDLVHLSSQKMAIWPTEGGMIEIVPETVGQYTGLRDCLGREIFEGDIVRQKWTATICDEYDDAFTATGKQTGIIVIRSKGVCLNPCFSVNDRTGDSSMTRNKKVSGYRSEIIGNSHDDPKLFTTICKL